jgi:hypothetical protein
MGDDDDVALVPAAVAVECISAFDGGRIEGRLPPLCRRVDATLAMIISQCSGLDGRSTGGWRPARSRRKNENESGGRPPGYLE